MTFKIGDRVRFVHNGISKGTVVEDPIQTATGERVLVKWDGSGLSTDWNPIFLREINDPLENDPNEVPDETITSRKERTYVDEIGTIIHIPSYLGRRIK